MTELEKMDQALARIGEHVHKTEAAAAEAARRAGGNLSPAESKLWQDSIDVLIASHEALAEQKTRLLRLAQGTVWPPPPSVAPVLPPLAPLNAEEQALLQAGRTWRAFQRYQLRTRASSDDAMRACREWSGAQAAPVGR